MTAQIDDIHDSTSLELWFVALASSASIGLTSLVPCALDTKIFGLRSQSKDSSVSYFAPSKDNSPTSGRLKLLLSFAVGSILGDIFLHLIPESIGNERAAAAASSIENSYKNAQFNVGLSVIAGFLMFIIAEKLMENILPYLLTDQSLNFDEKKQIAHDQSNNKINQNKPNNNGKMSIIDHNNNYNENSLMVYKKNDDDNNNNSFPGFVSPYQNPNQNNNSLAKIRYKTPCNTCNTNSKNKSRSRSHSKELELTKQTNDKKLNNDTAGYLNLIANGFDNFTHGLAVGASFLAGFKIGLVTTFVIIIHEIPHEICDYAILIKSGFSRWNAIRAQSSTAIFGILGTIAALSAKSIKALSLQTSWILPFSSGGFLYIALVNILPELLDKRTSSTESVKQVACVTCGIAFMAIMAAL